MAELLIVGAVMVGIAVSTFSTHRDWARVAKQVGFEPPAFPAVSRRMRGTQRGFQVEIAHKSDDSQSRLVLEIQGIDPGFTLGRDSAMARLIKPDIEIGERIFDDLVRVQGDPDLARAVLGNEARRLARHVITGAAGRLQDGKLQAFVSKITEVPAWLPTLLDLAETLGRPDPREVPRLLSQRALSDRSAGVRLQAFRQLASSFRRSDELHLCARRLLDSPDLALRLEACRSLLRSPDSEAGAMAARSLIDVAESPKADSTMRRIALESLARSSFSRLAVATMMRLLETSSLQSADHETAAIRTAALQGLLTARATDELLEVQLSDNPAEAEIFARGVGQLGSVSAQPRLLELLTHPSDRVRVEAIKALGAVGDARAVEPLRGAESAGLLQSLAISREADSAVAKIQGRLGGSQAGEISLAEVSGLEGAVSRSDASEGGEVSLMDDDTGNSE